MFLFCKAHEALGGEPSYWAAAERAGEAVWERGLLTKGPGGGAAGRLVGWGFRIEQDGCQASSVVLSLTVLCLQASPNAACHGVSGSAYALLRLHRSAGDAAGKAKWLHRAQQCALFMEG